MNYNPPPLNDSASSAVKKADIALYGIQVSLAQQTRPIEYYFHRRIHNSSGFDTSEDPEVMFASTIRAQLSEIIANVTRIKVGYFHKGLKLPGKPTQLFEPDTKTLMNQKALDVLIAKKPVAKLNRAQIFRKRLQSSKNKNTNSKNTVTTQRTSATTFAEARSSQKTFDRLNLTPSQESDRGDTAQGSWLFQPAVYNPQEDRGTTNSTRPQLARP
ncbi:hypothetical protein AYI69_g3832 [Smittium culicis]|uniref:Uncharacterized protein n=1 Tax=Smittium culicis TaxID=133412 RepID=A0A1R1YIK4_9FUNG|nr:hypothetical protein AYI69_g3832 [Smittium culicis]